MRLFATVFIALLFSGCAQSYRWVGGSGNFSQDDAQCTMYANKVFSSKGMPYLPEPEKSTTFSGSVTHYYGNSVDIEGTSTISTDSDQELINAIGDSIYRGMNADEAYKNCMKSKGYRKDYERRKGYKQATSSSQKLSAKETDRNESSVKKLKNKISEKFYQPCSSHGECLDGELCDQDLRKCIGTLVWIKKYKE